MVYAGGTSVAHIHVAAPQADPVVKYYRSISESVPTISDGVVSQLQALRTIGEPSYAISDSLVRVSQAMRSPSEPSYSISDSIVRQLQAIRTISDPSYSISDSITRILTSIRTISDPSYSISDSIVRVLQAIRTISEPSYSISDSVSRTAQLFRTITDNIATISDVIGTVITFARSISDTLGSILDSVVAIKSGIPPVPTSPDVGGAYTPISKRRVQGIQSDAFNKITIKIQAKRRKTSVMTLFENLTVRQDRGVQLKIENSIKSTDNIDLLSKHIMDLMSPVSMKLNKILKHKSQPPLAVGVGLLNKEEVVIPKDKQSDIISNNISIKTKSETRSESKPINIAKIEDYIENIEAIEKTEEE